MSKKTFFQRTKSIIKKLNTQKYASYESIEQYIEREMELLGHDIGDEDWSYSKRTFQRDIKEISEVWGIEIAFDKKQKGYYIDNQHSFAINNQRLFEIYEMMTALQLTEDLNQIILFEQRQPSNTHYFDDIIQAIKRQTYLEIVYQKFGDASNDNQIKIAPFGLKEHKNRWYIVARHQNKLRIYALDRIQSLSRLTEKWYDVTPINMVELFQHSFGIFTDEAAPVETVILEVKHITAPYLQSLPLHPSQKVITIDEHCVTFQLEIKLTEDFASELLTFGGQVKVIKPLSLQQRVQQKLTAALEQYK